MSRKLERMLRRMLDTTAIVLLVVGVGLFIYSQKMTSAPVTHTEQPLPKPAAVAATPIKDEKISKLLAAKMTKTIIPMSNVPVKPQVPDLGTLIRVKGIFAFGDPKNNEATIEHLKNNQTKMYKVGDTLGDINAKVIQIDAAVTFSYDGREIKMAIYSTERAEGPVAVPVIPEPQMTEKRR